MDSTLLLNASFEPLQVISWQKAVTLIYLEKVEVVNEYENEVRSVSVAIKIPAVVRLLRFINFRKRKPPLTRINLLARDEFSCQYCSSELTPQTATMDHVIPRSRGGKTTWDNLVLACSSCNRKKGSHTPEEASMALLKPPAEPDWLPIITLKFRRQIPESWRIFLGFARG